MPLEEILIQVPMDLHSVESHVVPSFDVTCLVETFFSLTKGKGPAESLGVVPNSVQPVFTPGGLPEANKLTVMRKCPPSQGVR